MALTKITTSLVAVNTLTAANIADNTIDATKIAQNQILARHIANATALTLDGGVTIDNISIDGTEIDLSSGSLTIDVASDLILDVGNDTIEIRDSGTKFGELISSSTDFVIKSSVSDKDLIFKGNDGGSAITALTLDMSDAGTAKFNNHLHLAGNADIVGQIGAYDNTAASWGAMGFRATNYTFKNSGGTVKVSIDSSGNVGIGETTPLGILHVKDADSGAGTPNESANTLVLEEDDNCGLSIFSGNNDNGMIAFGDAQDADVGSITYDHNTDALNFIVNASQRHTISSTGAAKSTINSDTDYSSTGEPAGILTLYNSNGADGAGVNNYSSLEFNTGDGATSQGFINYVRTADNQGKFTFSQRTGSSTYKEAMSLHNDGTLHVGFNEDQQSIFGRTWIGFCSGFSDYAGVGHIDVADTGGYALLQSSGGATFLNAEDGADIYFLNHGTTSMRLSSTGRLGLGVDPADGQGCQYGIQIKGGNDNYQATNFNESCQLSISTDVNTEGRYAAIRFTHIGNTEGFFGLVRRSATSDITDFVWQMYNGSTNTYQEHARLSSSALLTAAGKDNGAGGGTYGYMTCSTNLSGYTAGDYPTLKTDGNTIHFDANGTYTGYISHNTAFTDISDEREKDTIETISGATALVKQLRGVTHKWKDRRDDKTHYGLIAQEVEKVVPDVVSEGAKKDGETEATKGVAYQKLVPLLIETIKELEARITTLES